VLDTGDTLAEVAELRAFPRPQLIAAAAHWSRRDPSQRRDGALAFRPPIGHLAGGRLEVRWFDDLATAPHATKAAVRFPSVVLIAGGRNKGPDLAELAEVGAHQAVVAIGESARDVAVAFDGRRPVRLATSMDDAAEAAACSREGDVVLCRLRAVRLILSYSERGDDFVRGERAPRRVRCVPRRHCTSDDIWHPGAATHGLPRRNGAAPKTYVDCSIIATPGLLGLVMKFRRRRWSPSTTGSSWYVVMRQAMWPAGTVACVIVLRVDYHAGDAGCRRCPHGSSCPRAGAGVGQVNGASLVARYGPRRSTVGAGQAHDAAVRG
jgi:hypothetical protein